MAITCKVLCILGLIFFGSSRANARVFYVDGPRVIEPSPARQNFVYPMEGTEQSSRDLDMSFAAGDPSETPDDRSLLYPAKKMYAYSSAERPIVDINRDYERPISYYKLVDLPSRRVIYDDQYPRSNRKLIKINGEPHKGEIVLELRVTANTDNNEDRYLE